MKPYKRYFTEAILKANIEKAITIVNKIVGKRIGDRIFMSSIPDEVIKSGVGKIAGIICTFGGSRQIRYNWKLTDASGEIISIDIWNRIKLQPDLTIDTQGTNLVKLIDVITQVLQSKTDGVYSLEEDAPSKKINNEKPDKEIVASIKSWATTMDISDDTLSRTRISHLYSDYKYWGQEVAKESFKLASPSSFRNFLLDFMKQKGIKNIFMRQISVNKATKEVMYADSDEKKQFDASVFNLTLEDKMDFLEKSIMGVVNGYYNALILGGAAGIGKSKSLRDILYSVKGKFKIAWEDAKDFSRFNELYKYLYDHNSKDTIIVWDDVPSVLSKKFLPIVNAAMAPEAKRIISYATGFDKTVPDGYKDSFIFESKIIVITNIPRNKIPDSLLSRGSYVEIKIESQEVIDYIRQNIDNVMTEYKQATKEVKLDVLDFLEKIKRDITIIDFRIFKRICIMRLSGDPKWMKYAYAIAKGEA